MFPKLAPEPAEFDFATASGPLRLAGVVLWLVLSVPGRSDAGPVIPPGLKPGDQFRLMFITSSTTQATSSSIAYYDAFVTNAATAAGLTSIDGQTVTWQAVASTPTVDANNTDRLPTTSKVPIYRLDGVEIASSGANLWAAAGYLLAAPDINEMGNIQSSYVWTGTNFNGFGSADYQLGTQQSAPLDSEIGFSADIDNTWTQLGPTYQVNAYSVYAVSSIITVSSPVPEPSTLPLMASGAIFFIVHTSARRCRRGTRSGSEPSPPSRNWLRPGGSSNGDTTSNG
jgi:PEP-CTERM motif